MGPKSHGQAQDRHPIWDLDHKALFHFLLRCDLHLAGAQM
jgi:hypothetical protein